MCAGPYSQHILGIDEDVSTRMEAELVKKEDNEVLRCDGFPLLFYLNPGVACLSGAGVLSVGDSCVRISHALMLGCPHDPIW